MAPMQVRKEWRLRMRIKRWRFCREASGWHHLSSISTMVSRSFSWRFRSSYLSWLTKFMASAQASLPFTISSTLTRRRTSRKSAPSSRSWKSMVKTRRSMESQKWAIRLTYGIRRRLYLPSKTVSRCWGWSHSINSRKSHAWLRGKSRTSSNSRVPRNSKRVPWKMHLSFQEWSLGLTCILRCFRPAWTTSEGTSKQSSRRLCQHCQLRTTREMAKLVAFKPWLNHSSLTCLAQSRNKSAFYFH